MSARRLARALCLCALLAASFARAGMESPCSDPIVASGARVQVFILPFRADGPLGPAGASLGTVLQRQVLFSALKYGSIGVEQLTGPCRLEVVRFKVERRLKDGQVALYLQGRLFQQGDLVYVQTTLSSKTMGFEDRFTWDVGADAPTVTTTPSDPVAFQARTIPAKLVELGEAQLRAMRLHDAASADSPSTELPNYPDARFGFAVNRTQGNWMYVEMFDGGRHGWLSAESLVSPAELARAFPELYLVDGAIGYYGLGPEPDTRFERTAASLDRYLELSADRTESAARALAAILLGNAVLRASAEKPPSLETLQVAEKHYAQARDLSPQSGAPSNFYLASAAALCARGNCPENVTPVQIHAEYLKAINRDPTSTELLRNLKALYVRAASGKIEIGLPKSGIIKQLRQIQQIEDQQQR